jgi:hemoglobin
MENYAAQANPDGSLKTGPDGKLVKGELLRVFVMGKNAGWGKDAFEPLRNGNWIYAGYMPNGTRSPDDTNTCRACHLPLSGKDFVHRYDEHFSTRTAGAR